jgi:hypothetical protein
VDALDASYIEAETQIMEAKAVAAGPVADKVMGMMTPHPIQVVIILIYHHLNGMP